MWHACYTIHLWCTSSASHLTKTAFGLASSHVQTNAVTRKHTPTCGAAVDLGVGWVIKLLQDEGAGRACRHFLALFDRAAHAQRRICAWQ
jgi:hypothetical protein